ncbi:MAG: glutathione-dependent disulfide-bond oxidoreductase [Bermanella sp.]
MSDPIYTPPKVWKWEAGIDNRFSKINRPTAGATHDKVLPKGEHPFQLYSLATPNGVKVTVMLEELIELGFKEAEYDAYLVDIMSGDQFGNEFVEINPNSKIPALLDMSTNPPTRIFESGAILVHLAEKFDAFLPKEASQRAEVMSWLMWQMGATPMLGGGFGHFYAYAPEKYQYPIDRYTMEIKRQLDVLDKQLANNKFIAGDEYSIADMAIWAWYGALVKNKVYEAAEFIEAHTYTNVIRWTDEIAQRPAVKRGRIVNKAWGKPEEQLIERHSMEDFIR